MENFELYSEYPILDEMFESEEWITRFKRGKEIMDLLDKRDPKKSTEPIDTNPVISEEKACQYVKFCDNPMEIL